VGCVEQDARDVLCVGLVLSAWYELIEPTLRLARHRDDPIVRVKGDQPGPRCSAPSSQRPDGVRAH